MVVGETDKLTYVREKDLCFEGNNTYVFINDISDVQMMFKYIIHTSRDLKIQHL